MFLYARGFDFSAVSIHHSIFKRNLDNWAARIGPRGRYVNCVAGGTRRRLQTDYGFYVAAESSSSPIVGQNVLQLQISHE